MTKFRLVFAPDTEGKFNNNKHNNLVRIIEFVI